MPQPLSVYYYREPVAFYATLFTEPSDDGLSWRSPEGREVRSRAFKPGTFGQAYRWASSHAVGSTAVRAVKEPRRGSGRIARTTSLKQGVPLY